MREAAVRVAVMAKGGEWRVERWRGGERPEGEGEGGRRQGGRGGRRGGRRRRKERRRSAGCRERRGGVLSVCPCRHVCRQHLSCVHPAPVSPSSLSIAGHAPLGWTCRRRSGRPSSGPPRPPGSIRIRSVSSPAAVLRGRRPRARWARSAASLSCSVRSGRSSFTHVSSIVRMSWHQLKACPRPRLTSPDSCTVFGFCYLLVWGYIADLSMVPRLRRGRLAGILRGQKSI